MPNEKKTLPVRCPKCHTMNYLQREDFRGRAKITFKCAAKAAIGVECGQDITFDNPDFNAEG
jgi:phage FluMu protein Com